MVRCYHPQYFGLTSLHYNNVRFAGATPKFDSICPDKFNSSLVQEYFAVKWHGAFVWLLFEWGLIVTILAHGFLQFLLVNRPRFASLQMSLTY
jgi:hypothetical protein